MLHPSQPRPTNVHPRRVRKGGTSRAGRRTCPQGRRNHPCPRPLRRQHPTSRQRSCHPLSYLHPAPCSVRAPRASDQMGELEGRMRGGSVTLASSSFGVAHPRAPRPSRQRAPPPPPLRAPPPMHMPRRHTALMMRPGRDRMLPGGGIRPSELVQTHGRIGRAAPARKSALLCMPTIARVSSFRAALSGQWRFIDTRRFAP